MAYDPERFSILGDDTRPFARGSQDAIELLESITPAQKAQSVPVAVLWEIDPRTGAAMHANPDGSPSRPLSVIAVEPPKFGARVSDEFRFRERPPASIERIEIKSVNPRGTILYRTLDIHMVVHRPEIVFDEHVREDGSHVGDADQWSSLLTPGQAFALEYGWSASVGVKNGIINGDGFSDKSRGIAVPGRKQIRFVVTTYSFTTMSDNQTKLVIKAFELSELNLRQAYLAVPPDDSPSGDAAIRTVHTNSDVDPYANDQTALKKLLKKMQDKVSGGKVQKSQAKGGVMVPFGLLFDVVFADVIEKSLKDVGYEVAGLYVGKFNGRTGRPVPLYNGGASCADQPISDFLIPLDSIEKIFRDLLRLGTRLTVYNFLEPFLHFFSNPTIWDRQENPNPSTTTIPQVVLNTTTRRTRNGKSEISFYVFDTNREFTKFTPDDSQKLPRKARSKKDVRDIVVGKGIPFVSLLKGNSYVEDATFDAIQDEQMAGIFIRRYFSDKDMSRAGQVENPSVSAKENRAPAAQQIFSPVLKGKVVMLGNFVLDVFNLIWIDFGIPRWDGPFNVLESVDVIERGKFQTIISVFSAGTDPLGTKR